VELDKFNLQEVECQTNLQKLIYTMKTIHTHTFTNPVQFPKFWDEDWLKVAIDELDSRKMTPDEKASLEILIARNAESVKAESRKIAEAKKQEKEMFVKSLLQQTDFEANKIASIAGVSVDFVKAIQQQLL
jgi:hypothetical protein